MPLAVFRTLYVECTLRLSIYLPPYRLKLCRFVQVVSRKIRAFRVYTNHLQFVVNIRAVLFAFVCTSRYFQVAPAMVTFHFARPPFLRKVLTVFAELTPAPVLRTAPGRSAVASAIDSVFLAANSA